MIDIVLQVASVVLHTFVIYIFLIFTLSLIGHRETANLSIAELVVVMVLGSAVETAMVSGDKSLLAGLVSAGTLLVSNRLMSLAMERWPRLRRLIIGHPTLLVYRGKYLHDRMRQAGLTEEDVLEGIHERGYESVEQVRFAVLEIDGTVSVVPKKGGKGEKGKGAPEPSSGGEQGS